MLNLTFKDVGHGDSIILEWEHQNQNKIALIDCNISDDNRNPSLEYLKSPSNTYKYREIEFILLSHPHYDHYSGLNRLLQYCSDEKIIINLFMHTAFTTPRYLIETAVKSFIAKDELKQLFGTIDKLTKNKIIKSQGYITSDFREISLSDSIKLNIIAPTTEEFEKFRKQIKFSEDDESCHNNANANLLSTVIKLSTDKWIMLLTSDCQKHALEYYNQRDHDNTKKAEFFLGQSPHHGSINNHNKEFWNSLERTPETKIVFSCGVNSYNHPSHEVVKYFKENHYNIEFTNKVGGLCYEDIVIENISIELDLSSDKKESSYPGYSERGDKVFKLD